MKKPIKVPANEALHIRVFALSMSEARATTLPATLSNALGVNHVSPDGVEIFARSALGEMSLSDFLIEGNDVIAESVEPDRAKLDALEGYIMLVYSSAFKGKAAALTPQPELTLIGTYPQHGVDTTSKVDLETPAALPQDVAPEAPPARKRPSDAAMSGRIATLALLVAFAVVALMIWIGG
ncbi:hypothetical protein [Sulfitobacter sp. JB4-11]|uniref:hypothetical protein n=1 Tax=Sulfitobacter rhodophyticola TaxID=3238304 RepID=UPI003513C306